ncbi:MAG TPA: NifU family protein [Alphaproteobacteria bacterium]|nr:NifU family protein [Alphaproteobacteria bacterium]
MFIQTEETPNPQVLKFIPGDVVLTEGTATFTKGDACGASSFAKRLLVLDGIESLFLGADFISVTKQEAVDWYVLKPDIIGLIMEYFVAKKPLIDNGSDFQDRPLKEFTDPLCKQIQELIETRVRPAVAQDGGDIEFEDFKEGIVYLKLSGACQGCPSSTMTLKSGIENMLKYYVPEVVEVRQIQ